MCFTLQARLPNRFGTSGGEQGVHIIGPCLSILFPIRDSSFIKSFHTSITLVISLHAGFMNLYNNSIRRVAFCIKRIPALLIGDSNLWWVLERDNIDFNDNVYVWNIETAIFLHSPIFCSFWDHASAFFNAIYLALSNVPLN